MKTRLATCLFTGCALLLILSPLSAHHSFAMFDRSQVTSLKGVVKEFQWTNPHSWVQLVVQNDSGATEEWALEALSPNVLGRMGWKRNSLKPGDKITAYFNPTRDGSHGGNLVKVVTADGKTVGSEQ
jgi:Family of unknown function (DUF6152)